MIPDQNLLASTLHDDDNRTSESGHDNAENTVTDVAGVERCVLRENGTQ